MHERKSFAGPSLDELARQKTEQDAQWQQAKEMLACLGHDAQLLIPCATLDELEEAWERARGASLAVPPRAIRV